MLELFEFSALFGGGFSNVGIAERFLVRVPGTVAGSFVGAIVVALDNGPGQRLQPIIICFGQLVQLSPQGIHKGGVGHNGAAEFQIVTDLPRLNECVRDVTSLPAMTR